MWSEVDAKDAKNPPLKKQTVIVQNMASASLLFQSDGRCSHNDFPEPDKADCKSRINTVWNKIWLVRMLFVRKEAVILEGAENAAGQ